MLEQIFIAPKQNSLEDSIAFSQKHQLGLELPNFMYPNVLMNRHEEVKQYQTALAGFKLPVTMHGPVFDVNPVSLDPEIADISRQRYEPAIECALALNARFLVLHTQWTPIYQVADCYQPWLEGTISFFQNIIHRYVQDTSLTLVLENFLDPAPNILNDLVTGIDSPHLQACLDIGHVNLFSKIAPTDWLDSLGSNLAYVHAHNNWGRLDEHSPLQEGNLDMEGFLTHASLSPHRLQLVIEVLTLEGISQSLPILEPYLRQKHTLLSAAGHYLL